MKKIKLEISEELRKGLGTVFLSMFSLLFIFLVVTPDAIVLTVTHIVLYCLLDIVFFVLGFVFLNSIRKTERDKVRYIAGESNRHIVVRVDG